MIVVTGGTGALGRAIVENLVKLAPAGSVAASVRNPDKAAGLKALGVRVRAGDFDDAPSLRQAFEGASQVLLVSSNARATGGDTLAQHSAAIEAAKSAGAKRIVYTSQMASAHDSLFPPARDHAATEDMLRDSGLAWTALRHGFYASSAIQMLAGALATGKLEAPADGRVAWTTHADLAQAAARILVEEGRFDGPTPALTASDTHDMSDLASMLTEIGRPASRETISDDEMRARLLARGLPAAVADISLGFYGASRAGEFAPANPTLSALLNREPITMREFLRSQVAAQAAA